MRAAVVVAQESAQALDVGRDPARPAVDEQQLRRERGADHLAQVRVSRTEGEVERLLAHAADACPVVAVEAPPHAGREGCRAVPGGSGVAEGELQRVAGRVEVAELQVRGHEGAAHLRGGDLVPGRQQPITHRLQLVHHGDVQVGQADVDDHGCRRRVLAGLEQMRERPQRWKAAAGPAVQLGDRGRWAARCQLLPQERGEQVVGPPRLLLAVAAAREEQVPTVELPQEVLTVVVLHDDVPDVRCELVEYRHVEQEGPEPFRQHPEHLGLEEGAQVRQDAGGSRTRCDGRASIHADVCCGEPDRRCPAAAGEQDLVDLLVADRGFVRQHATHRLAIEPEVVQAEIRDPTPNSPSRQRQGRLDPRPEHDPDVRREVVDEVLQERPRRPVVDRVAVVEHQGERCLVAQVVDERGDQLP